MLSLSSEEEAELARSNKKVKESHSARSVEDEPPGFKKIHTRPKLSFKEKLVGEIPGAFTQAFDFTRQMEYDLESDDDVSELSEGIAAIKLSREDKIRIREPSAKAFIVKVYGKYVGYHYIQAKLQSMWKPVGRLDCINLDKEFFLTRFYAKEDYDLVLQKGPWFVGENFLSIRPWEPNFRPFSANVSSIAVWVRLNELPIKYYESHILKHIGSSIGNVLQVDTHTAVEARGRYARICVQIDINKPLVSTVLIGDLEQPLLYEGINRLCFSCGHVGHRKESCPYTIRPPSSPAKEDTSPSPIIMDDTCNVHATGPTEQKQADVGIVQEDNYEPWLVVTRRKNSKNMHKVSPTKCSHSPEAVSSGAGPSGHSPPNVTSAKENSSVHFNAPRTLAGDSNPF